MAARGEVLWRVAAVAAILAAAWLSLTPQPPKPEGAPEGSDLLAHVAMHGGAAFALARGWTSGGGPAAVALGLAAGLELGQLAAPGRTFSPADLAMNFVGVAAGTLAAGILRRLRPLARS